MCNFSNDQDDMLKLENTEGQSIIDNPEKHWVHKNSDNDKQNKKHNSICV